MAHMKIIGFKGEKMVYDFLAEKMPNWTYQNWTSRLRKRAGFPGFSGEEGHHSDFTYNDTELCMREWLRSLGVPMRAHWSISTTYHIEVKTTKNHHLVPFRISDNQVELMRAFSRQPEAAYMIFLVHKVDTPDKRGIEVFSQPWELQRYRNIIFQPSEDSPLRDRRRERCRAERKANNYVTQVRKCAGYSGYRFKLDCIEPEMDDPEEGQARAEDRHCYSGAALSASVKRPKGLSWWNFSPVDAAESNGTSS